MFTAAKARLTKQRARTSSVAAPLGGWNARDALGAMGPQDAVSLTNFFPGTSAVILRSGYSRWATGITGQVQTVMGYVSGTTSKLLAIAGTSVYDVTSSGAVGAASLTGLTNAKFQYINFTTTGGSYLVMLNGADKMRSFDGTSWHADGDGGAYDVTGVNTQNCINIQAFKNRIWMIQKQSLKAWYLPVNAIGGAAASLDMSSVFQDGGYLVAGMTWTIDAGYGVDDLLAFITSTGEIAVWRLTDPTAPTGISLIGLYSVGAPIGYRCYIKYKGDLLIITQDGVTPMAQQLQSSRLDPRVNITDKIQFAVSTSISSYGSNFGWQLLSFPKENMLFLNVPLTEGSQQQQYVMNTITGSWCNFTGWEANCWELYGNQPYFGGNGFVGKAWTGTSDNSSAITANALQSFQDYGYAGQKSANMIRYHLFSNMTPNVSGNVNVDYDLSDYTAPLSTVLSGYGLWDSAVWDSQIWGGDLAPTAEWQGCTGIGYTLAPAIKTSTSGISLQWISTDVVYEPAGIL